MSIKQGISTSKLNEKLINRGGQPAKVRLVPLTRRSGQPLTGLGPGGLSQRWGRTNGGFVIDMLDMMGLAFDNSSQLQHRDISRSEMDKFIEELERRFGYTLQQKIGAAPKIYFGSRERSGGEILFHGTRRGCLEFLKWHDSTIRSSKEPEKKTEIKQKAKLLAMDESLPEIFPEIYAINEGVRNWLTPGGKYTLQENEEDKIAIIRNSKHGVKSGFGIIFSGSYQQCLEIKQVVDYPNKTQ